MNNNSKPRQAKYLDIPTAASSVVNDSDAVTKVIPMNVDFDQEGVVVKGTIQEPAYRDKWFGIVFVAHLLTIVSVAVLYATGRLETVVDKEGPTRRLVGRLLQYDNDEASSSNATTTYNQEEEDATSTLDKMDAVRLVSCVLLSLVSAPLLSLLAMKYMLSHGIQLIQASLYFAIALNLAFGILLALSTTPLAAIWNFLFAAILACYAKAVWHRISFAAATLKAAVTCVHSNLGMVFLGLASIPLFVVWLCLWGFVWTSVLNSPWIQSQEHQVEVTDDYVYGSPNTHVQEEFTPQGCLAIAGLLLSFYWTWHVLRNVVHTTLAGTVGTWWFLPQEANGCCSRGLRDSASRALTYSFGSICLGSLIVAIIEVLKSMLRSMAHNRRGGLLRLFAQCLLGWIERIAEYFNKWAFVYVGLYGYSYVEAGKNVFSLFQNRGWSTIISDSLIHRMLGMMCLCIGLLNALAAVFWTIGSDGGVMAVSAAVAFFMGLVFSNMTFGVLVSAVDSVIVLYAEAPAEFQENHPALCRELEEAWTQAWPDIFSPAPMAVARQIV